MTKISDAPIKTFSIGFQEKDFDETPYALMVAKHLRTEHQSEILSVDELMDLIPEMIQSFDEPFFDSSAFPSIAVARLARKKVSVVLTGDGGDEFFGGYHYYKIIGQMNSLYALPNFVNAVARQMIGLIPSHKFQLLTQALEMRNSSELYSFLRSIQKDFPTTVNDATKQTTSSMMEYYLGQFKELRSLGVKLDPVSEAMRMDALNILPDEYLTKVDLATMGQSLEARNPFLDHELVEWAVQLPIDVKIKAGISKKVLRDAGRELLPPTILHGKKKGFVVPIDRWLRTSLKDWAYSIISDDSLYGRVPIDKNIMLDLFSIHQSGKRNAHPILWAAIMFLVFAKEHENFPRLDL
jgi:asparagine synthase (glutamine-hydrolysing)